MTASAPPVALRERYRRFTATRLLILAGLLATLFTALVFDVSTGPSTFPFIDVVRGLFNSHSLPQAQQVIHDQAQAARMGRAHHAENF